MADTVTHGVGLSQDKQTIRMEIAWGARVLWVDLGIADVDVFIDALGEMREQMVENPSGNSN
jgi:hypothetical protein